MAQWLPIAALRELYRHLTKANRSVANMDWLAPSRSVHREGVGGILPGSLLRSRPRASRLSGSLGVGGGVGNEAQSQATGEQDRFADDS